MLATSMKRAGKRTVARAREMVTSPSSSGCRSTSSTARSNSGSGGNASREPGIELRMASRSHWASR